MIDFVLDERQDVQDRLMPGGQRIVRLLADVIREVPDKLLCSPGVGAENEFEIRAKVAGDITARVAFVGPCRPCDTLQGDDLARHAIAAHR